MKLGSINSVTDVQMSDDVNSLKARIEYLEILNNYLVNRVKELVIVSIEKEEEITNLKYRLVKERSQCR